MAFLTPEQIRAVRMKGSTLLKLPSLDQEIRVIKMGSDHVLTFGELNLEVEAGKKRKADSFRFMIEHGCVDLAGTPLTPEDAEALVSVLSIDELTTLLEAVSGMMKSARVAVSKAGAAVVEAEVVTPAEKKDGAS